MAFQEDSKATWPEILGSLAPLFGCWTYIARQLWLQRQQRLEDSAAQSQNIARLSSKNSTGAGEPGSPSKEKRFHQQAPQKQQNKMVMNLRCTDNCRGWVIGLFLPFYAFHCLSTRLRRWRVFAFLNLLLVVTIISTVVGIFTDPQAASWLIGTSILLVGLMLFVFGVYARQDDVWTRIHDFQGHRVMRWTFKNCIAVCSLLSMIFQMASLASKLLLVPDPRSPSGYDRLKLRLKAALGPFLLEFEFKHFRDFSAEDVEDVVAYSPLIIAAVGVFVWWVLYAGVATQILRLATLQVGSNENTEKLNTRHALYQGVSLRPIYTSIFMILSDLLPTAIVAGLVSGVDCWPNKEKGGVLALERDVTLECFRHGHEWVSLLAFWALICYIFASVLIAPFMIADSDGAFDNSSLDVRYEPLFLMQERLCKCMLAAASVYWNRYTLATRVVYLATASWLAFLAGTSQPSSVRVINTVRTAMYNTSVVIGICVLIDGYGVKWWPLWGVVFGVFIISAVTLQALRAMLRRGLDRLIFSDIVGTSYGDTAMFSDIGLLRGVVHRLKALRVYQRDGFNGIEMLYQVDGVVIRSPLYLSSWMSAHDCPTEMIVFEADEFLVALHERGDADVRWGIALATNKGRQFLLGCPNDSFPVPDVQDWKVQCPEGYVAVGVFGGKNGHIHHLGLIMEKSVERGAKAGVLNLSFPKLPFPSRSYGKQLDRE